MDLNPIRRVLRGRDGSNLSQYLAAIAASLALFISGIHVGWPAPSLEIILSPDYPFDIGEDEGSSIVVISYLGHIIGGMSAATLVDAIGRKWTILSLAFPQMTALVMIYTSHYSKYLLYSARIVGGISEGAALAALPIYIAEVAEPEIRGILGTFMSFVFVLGVLFVNLVGSYCDIYKTALIGMAFPVLFFVIFVNFPETPYYLYMKQNTEGAINSLKVLRRKKSVWKEAENLSAAVTRQMSESGGYIDLFRISSNRKAFFLMSAARIFQQFSGATAYGLYSHLLLGESTKVSPIFGSSLLMFTQMVVIFLSFFYIDKVGRKTLLTVSSALSSFMLFVQASFSVFKKHTSLDLTSLHWLPLLVMVFFVSFFTMGLGVAMNVLMSEMFSSSIKAKAFSLGSIVFSLSMMGSIKYYQFTSDYFNLTVTFYSFATFTLFGTFFFYFLLPETKGKTLEAIQQDLKKRSKRIISFGKQPK